ncbi:MAG: hypothetical protein V7607_3630 [Solirubrobacteraceae bacterium]
MSRLTRLGWFLLALVVVTGVLAFVAPGLAIIGAAVLALALLGVLADGVLGLGLGPDPGLLGDQSFVEHRREALRERLRRGRPKWETTPPDHADEHPDSAWQRERQRRGLG